MTVLEALVLGIIQGLGEFLPISSSGHLVLTPYVFGWEPAGLAFDAALHLGTAAAVLWYFRQEWLRLVGSAVRLLRTRRVETDEERRVLLLAVATVPAVIGGLLLEDLAETTFRSPFIVATQLIVMGVLLWLVDRAASQHRDLTHMRWRDAVLIGLAQVIALVPGTSRSGATITAGRALGMSRESAAVFSFLMSMPITVGAGLLKVPDVLGNADVGLVPLLVGVLSAGLSGWLAIAVLLRYVARNSYGIFAVYRVVLGVGILAFFLLRG